MTVSKGALVAKLNTDSLFGTTEEERAKVRRLAAGSALRQKAPAADLSQLLDMLGLLDGAKPETSGCRVCGGPLKAWTLGPKSGMKGCCSRPCRAKFLEGQPAKPKPVRPVACTGRCSNAECGIPIYPQGVEVPSGGKRHGGRGLCSGCYAAVRRAEKKAAAR